MKKINKKLLLSTSLLMPILPIFATISCNNKKTNDSTEQQFDLTKLDNGFYNISGDYFSDNQIQLAGGLYFVLNNQDDTKKMESDLGSFYKALLTEGGKSHELEPSDDQFNIVDGDKISKPNKVAILDRDTIELVPVSSANFQKKPSSDLVEISVTKGGDKSQITTYELHTVELTSEINLEYIAKADLYDVLITGDKTNATLTPVGGGEKKISLSTKKAIQKDDKLNKRDKVTILVKKWPQS
ncbi:MAG: hypothetical protein IJ970_01310 [Mycoplasmataceae bacterium]|nr:hypothetical protein [Mycoplasmataceae bacterium]